VAFANALGLQLEAARATPALCRFNYDAMPSLTSLEPIHCRIIAFLLLIRRWYAIRRDLDLWPWTFAAYRLWRDEALRQIWTQSNNLIAISVFDLMTLNMF